MVGTTATTLNGARTGHGVIITTTDGGSTWTAQRVPKTAAAFTAVSCPVAGSCVAVGTTLAATPEAGIVVLTGNGSNVWKHADSLAVSQPVAAVSCPSLGHCVMVGETVSERLDRRGVHAPLARRRTPIASTPMDSYPRSGRCRGPSL